VSLGNGWAKAGANNEAAERQIRLRLRRMLCIGDVVTVVLSIGDNGRPALKETAAILSLL